MNPEAIAKSVQETLEKSIPELVASAYEAKSAEDKTEMKNIVEALTEVKASLSLFGNKQDVKKAEMVSKAGAFFKELAKNGQDVVAANTKAAFLNEGTAAEGGYMVPVEFAKEILYVAKEYGIARKYCHIIPMGTDTKDITKITAGVTAYWTAEGVAYTASKPTIASMQLIAKKMTALVGSTQELIDDNMTEEEVFTLITRLIAEKFAAFEDEQVFTGDGTGNNFLGLEADTTVNLVTPGAITYDKLVDAMVAVDGKFLKNKNGVKWRMNRVSRGTCLKLKDTTGQPLLQMNITDEPFGRIFGYGVEIVDDLANGSVVFGDLFYYALGDRRSITMSIGYATGEWEKDIQSIKASQRIAGKIKFAEAFAVLLAA